MFRDKGEHRRRQKEDRGRSSARIERWTTSRETKINDRCSSQGFLGKPSQQSWRRSCRRIRNANNATRSSFSSSTPPLHSNRSTLNHVEGLLHYLHDVTHQCIVRPLGNQYLVLLFQREVGVGEGGINVLAVHVKNFIMTDRPWIAEVEHALLGEKSPKTIR